MIYSEFIEKYPQYKDAEPEVLAVKLHDKYYSHVSQEDFNGKFLVEPATAKPQTEFVEGGTMGQMSGHSTPKEESPYVNKVDSFGEFMQPIMAVGSSVALEPAAGWAGLAQTLNPLAEEGAGARAVESVRGMAYQPTSPKAKGVMSEVGSVIEPVAQAAHDVIQGAADKTFDVTGSPTAAAAVATAPTALMLLFGMKGYKNLKAGEVLVENGEPTLFLRKHLAKKGFDYHSLPEEVKASIPDIVEPKLLPGGKPVKAEVNKVVTETLKAGGEQDALFKYELSPEGTAVKSPVGINAVKQGFREGFVQSVKTANKATKAAMRKMAHMRRAISTNSNLKTKIRPSDIAGGSVTKRLQFIKDTIEREGRKLNVIAKRQLKNKNVNPMRVVNTLKQELKDLDIGFNPETLELDFNGSAIAADPTSQKAIKTVVKLLKYGGEPNAYRFHALKQQLSKLVDYRKKSPYGLTPTGEKVIKSIRRSLNESLRVVSKPYAEVNDKLAAAFTAVENIDKATGSIAIFGDGADAAIGTKLRGILSNNNNRQQLINALTDIDELTAKLGGKFEDDMFRLVDFDSELNHRFGTTADNSLAGQMEEANNHSFPTSKKGAILGTADKIITKGLDKVRGVNEFEAYEALESLLK